MRAAGWIVVAGVVVLLVAGGGGAVVVTARKRAGKRVTVTDAPAGADGVVRVRPAELAARAGVPLEVYALARMLASEHPRDSERVRAAVAHVALNEARRRGTDIVKLLLLGRKKVGGKSVPSASDGWFGAQWTGKYAATTLDPAAGDIDVARRVLSGALPDDTGGAVQFDSPRAQRAAQQRKVTGYSKGPEEVAASRRAEGKELVTLAGVDPELIRFWRPRRA